MPDMLSKEDAKELDGTHSAEDSHTPGPDPSFIEVKLTSDEVPPTPQQELIDPNDVLKALKSFVEENNKHRVRHVVLTFTFTTVLLLIFVVQLASFSGVRPNLGLVRFYKS